MRVLAIALALAAPSLATAGSIATEVGPDDLADGVPAEAIELPEGWTAEDKGADLVIEGAASGVASLVIDDVPLLAHRVTTEAGVLIFSIDGREVARYDGEGLADDFAFDTAAHKLTWRFLAEGRGASFALDILGMTAITPASVDEGLKRLSACGPVEIPMAARAAVPLDGTLRATWDGVPVDVLGTTSALDGHDVLTSARVAIPADLATHGEHALRLEVGSGEVGTVVDRAIMLVVQAMAFSYPPAGFVYDRTPTISLSLLGCLTADADVTLRVDGELVEGDSYTFPAPLAFGEEHDYRFTIELPGGRVIQRAATFVEGLDVVAYDLEDARLLYVADGVSASYLATGAFGDTLYSAAQGHFYAPLLVNVAGPRVQVVAEYAPLELRCAASGEARVCSPYGGGSPQYAEQFGWLAPASFDGRSVGSAGQIAAAAWFSRPATTEAELPDVVLDAELRAQVLDAVAEAAGGAST